MLLLRKFLIAAISRVRVREVVVEVVQVYLVVQVDLRFSNIANT